MAGEGVSLIVRILGEGQYELDAEGLADLKRADDRLVEAVASADELAFAREFGHVLELIRGRGRVVPVDRLIESDLVLPAEGASLAEAQRLFAEHPLA